MRLKFCFLIAFYLSGPKLFGQEFSIGALVQHYPDRGGIKENYFWGFVSRPLVIFEKTLAPEHKNTFFEVRKLTGSPNIYKILVAPGLKWGGGNLVGLGDQLCFPQAMTLAKYKWTSAREIEIESPKGQMETMYFFSQTYLLPKENSWDCAKNSLSFHDILSLGHEFQNGPYIATRFKKYSFIEFQRNKFFYKIPYFSKITIKFYVNEFALSQALQRSEVAAIFPLFEKFIPEKESEHTHKLIESPSHNFYKLDFNLKNDLLKDERNRQALNLAFSREKMYKDLDLSDFQQQQRVDPLWWIQNYDDFSIKRTEVNLELVQKLLEASNVTKERDALKTKPIIVFDYFPYTNEVVKIAQYIKSSWEVVGFEVVLNEEKNWQVFLDLLKSRKWKGVILYRGQFKQNIAIREHLHSDSIPKLSNNYQGHNYNGYENLNLDNIIDQLDSQESEYEIFTAYKKILSIYYQDLPSIGLYMEPERAFVPKELLEFKPSGQGLPSSYSVENWSM
jgi:ABC-type oligopeptide transport system substrate-binding subunit